MPSLYGEGTSASAIYAYAGNDPVNHSDSNGHKDPDSGGEISGVTDSGFSLFSSLFGDGGTRSGNPDTGGVGNDSYSRSAQERGQDRDAKSLQNDFADRINKTIEDSFEYQMRRKSEDFERHPLAHIAKTVSESAIALGPRAGAIGEATILGIEVKALSNATKIHGNSLLSEKPTYGYKVVDMDTGEILKIGQTSAVPPTSRYSRSFYRDNNARMDLGTEATSKEAARDWEHFELRSYYDQNGKLPTLNKGFR